MKNKKIWEIANIEIDNDKYRKRYIVRYYILTNKSVLFWKQETVNFVSRSNTIPKSGLTNIIFFGLFPSEIAIRKCFAEFCKSHLSAENNELIANPKSSVQNELMIFGE